MINKARRKLVWCSETPLYVANHNGKREGSKICSGKSHMGRPYHVPAKVRCPLCGKAFKPRVRECMDQNCWHIDIPPHKKYVKRPV